jgi:hypothetical protein
LRGWLIATVACVTAIAGTSLWVGPTAIIGPWDVFTLLDGAYRIYEGQGPSTDFSNPVGPLVYGLIALCMHVSPTLRAVTYSQVLFVAIACPLAWNVSSRRLPAPYAAGFTVFAAWLLVSVRPLGFSYQSMTYAMLYNTEAWVLYATLLLLVLGSRRGGAAGGDALRGDAHGRAAWTYPADGLNLGLLLGLLFYDKITFFIAAIAAAGLGLVLGTLPRSPRLGLGAAAGFAIVAVMFRFLFALHTIAYVRNLIAAAHAQASGQRVGMLIHIVKWTAPITIIMLLVALLVVSAARSQGWPARPLASLLIAAAFVTGSSLVISAGDANERSDIPALLIVPLLAVAFLEQQLPWWAGGSAAARPPSWHPRQYKLLLAGLAALVVGTSAPIAGQDALAMGEAISYRSYVADPPASQRFDAGPLADFVIPADANYETAYRRASDTPAMINNGLALLRQNVRSGQTLFSLADTDPFAMSLHLPLNHCGPLWWDLNFDFSPSDHVSARCAIGDATWVIIPKMVAGQGCCQETVSVMLHLYSGYLARYYHLARQTQDWTLLRRDTRPATRKV